MAPRHAPILRKMDCYNLLQSRLFRSTMWLPTLRRFGLSRYNTLLNRSLSLGLLNLMVASPYLLRLCWVTQSAS